MSAYRLAVFGCTALLAVGTAACGDSSDDGGNNTSSGSTPEASAGNADTVILGTTDKVAALDPAACYDLAIALQTGQGVKPDPARALALFKQACTAGQQEACDRARRQ